MNSRKMARGVRMAVAGVTLVAVGLAFSGAYAWITPVIRLQFGPTVVRVCASFTTGALSVALGVVLATLLCGRYYCAALCPLGILQDVAGWLSRRKGHVAQNFAKTRYVIAGLSFGLLFGGWSTGFFLLDPWSNFGRMVAGFSAGGLVLLGVIIVLAVWKKRIYCTVLCPVGTVLGLLAKKGLSRLELRENCVKCGKCVAVCPSGCIEPTAGMLDNERCVRCMNCLSVCPVGAIRFTGPRRRTVAPVDVSRRAFLVNSGVLLAGLAAGAVLAKTGMAKVASWIRRSAILPPGAGDAERFAARCTACRLCVANCPAGILVSTPENGGQVSLDLSRGACMFNCHRCSQVCPTGAIRPLTLAEKQRTQIAEARFNPPHCYVFQTGEFCGRCAAACPVHAITLGADGVPQPVDLSRCVGCGACQKACPAPEKAMTVHAVARQTRLRGGVATSAHLP